ncbi:MAG: hypothetical protein ACI9S8_002098 [Chlamydiales bacterium]|jgi:hypothetical protein
MDCPLCGADNHDSAKVCYICDSAFVGNSVNLDEEIQVGNLETKPREFTYKRVLTYLGLLLLIAIPWFLMGDLFQSPSGVVKSRQEFFVIKSSYEKDKDRWDFQKDQILEVMNLHRLDDDIGKEKLLFESIPLEIMMAYLIDDLEISKRFEDLVIFPAYALKQPKIILSKYESKIWPFQIPLSLEIEIYDDGDKLEAKFLRLQRGKREVPSALAWVYFGTELQALRSFTEFSGGLRGLKLYRKENVEDQSKPTELLLSWKYFHRSIFR